MPADKKESEKAPGKRKSSIRKARDHWKKSIYTAFSHIRTSDIMKQKIEKQFLSKTEVYEVFSR